MGVYVIDGQDTNTADTTVLSLNQPASALKRIKVHYVQIGSDATADNAAEVVVQRTTDEGTNTDVVPQPRDAADGTASAIAGEAHSVEPTYTAAAIQLNIFAHQQATYQWYAAPGAEIIIPVTNNAGLGVKAITAATPWNMGVVMEFTE